jgi:hypothetical protein
MRGWQLLTASLLASTLGCQGLVDTDVAYVDCFRSPDGDDVETFETDEEPLGAARCWHIDNTQKPAYVRAADHDLVIHPYAEVGAHWTDEAQAPFFFRTLSGDFLAIARAEAVSTTPGTDHCLGETEAAGLVLRRRQPLAWTTLLVRPELEPMAPLELCGDEPASPPAARVLADSFGFDSHVEGVVNGVGDDGETYVALCRHDNELFYFYRDISARREAPALDFKPGFTALDVGLGPVDVGLTATAEQGAGTLPEGHFNWLVLQDYADAPPPDGCNGAFERFAYPEEE